LRERKDDIPLLFAHLAREARARYRRDIPDMTPALEADLLAHDWPGNVRELLNLVDRAWHAATLEIGPEDLSFDRGIPLNMRAGGGWAPDLQRDVLDLDEEVNRYTARVVQEMLERCNRDTRETARRLKISERTVYRWMRRQQQQDSDTAGSSR
ncbi:MAG: helix-turn-helix domain-containing protein, partial [Candidatus Cloacimonetes bacterium]|nr:helix-turn-helix domain-containing protein [Candidatus Cloacimonadota bacterium]